MELEKKHKEKSSWDKETISKVQGLSAACQRFDRLVAFAVLYNVLEPLKPLVTKLQKHNQDIYQAYQTIDQVINDLRETKDNMDEEFHHWYEMACEMAKSVGVMPSEPRLAKCWSRYRNNVPSKDCEPYYRRAIGVPVMDALIVNLHDRMTDRKHTKYPLFVFHQNLTLMPLLHHFKTLLVTICQQTRQVFFEEVSVLFIDLHKRRLFNEKTTA